jgi:hypothetical protein
MLCQESGEKEKNKEDHLFFNIKPSFRNTEVGLNYSKIPDIITETSC